MRLALLVFVRTCQVHNVLFWLLHVGTKANCIADLVVVMSGIKMK